MALSTLSSLVGKVAFSNKHTKMYVKIFVQSAISFLGTFVIVILGTASKGELLMFCALGWKHLDRNPSFRPASGRKDQNQSCNGVCDENQNIFKNAYFYVVISILISFLFFYGLGGYLQLYYYILRRNKPEEWKCQPTKFLSKKEERHEILVASVNLLIGSIMSGLYTTYIMNNGKLSYMYYDVSEQGWVYLLCSTIALFLYQDGALYYAHRLFHHPWLYKHIHKYHHKYHCPTAFSAVAFHPIEFFLFQFLLIAPIFILPIHYTSFIGCACYVYYYGIIDHSGIDLKAIWPWQPPVRFHDDHHKYFHVNFGFNTLLFDRFHDTLRKKDRKYGENVFGGKGLCKNKHNIN